MLTKPERDDILKHTEDVIESLREVVRHVRSNMDERSISRQVAAAQSYWNDLVETLTTLVLI